jgi:hypothetical protein
MSAASACAFEQPLQSGDRHEHALADFDGGDLAGAGSLIALVSGRCREASQLPARSQAAVIRRAICNPVPLSYDESTKGLDETSKKLRAFFN